MENPVFKRVGIVGAGTMGAGIAHVCAQAGCKVLLFDAQSGAVARGMATIQKNLEGAVQRGKMANETMQEVLARISTANSLEDLKVDLVVEAIVEQLEVKQEVFAKLAAANGPETVLTSNTSSIPITRIARHVALPGRVAGFHFFNPAHLMKLVEVVCGAETENEVAEKLLLFAKQLGKTGVHVADSPGFIVNRVARPYYVESLLALEEGVAKVEVLDELLENAGFKMGPFKLMDLIGVDVNFSVTSSMFALFHQDGKFRPSRIQQQKVDAGQHGRKTGRGFYSYEK